MRGYLLIATSGILFFIISVITVLHLMSARTLTSQYRGHAMYQALLDQDSIRNILWHMIDQNAASLDLPSPLAEKYSITSQNQGDGSVVFSVINTINQRETTFNVSVIETQAYHTQVDDAAVSVANHHLNGLSLTSPISTHLVQIRTVWTPASEFDTVTHYGFYSAGDGEHMVTANVQNTIPFDLPTPESGMNHQVSVYFSTLSEAGVISIYFKYSDGSIKNALIEY
jgi:hypothetical protein